jgi:hypothetical protein
VQVALLGWFVTCNGVLAAQASELCTPWRSSSSTGSRQGGPSASLAAACRYDLCCNVWACRVSCHKVQFVGGFMTSDSVLASLVAQLEPRGGLFPPQAQAGTANLRPWQRHAGALCHHDTSVFVCCSRVLCLTRSRCGLCICAHVHSSCRLQYCESCDAVGLELWLSQRCQAAYCCCCCCCCR